MGYITLRGTGKYSVYWLAQPTFHKHQETVVVSAYDTHDNFAEERYSFPEMEDWLANGSWDMEKLSSGRDLGPLLRNGYPTPEDKKLVEGAIRSWVEDVNAEYNNKARKRRRGRQ